ncbi:MAG: hypothetical protein HONBIEJF_00113 [Fimbriimonadaceae bacterium]|nr:hypothetical protein [Fimbriimonadaceae bacterium]
MNYIVLGVLMLALIAFAFMAGRSRKPTLDWVRRVQDVDPRARHWIMAGIRERNWLADKLGSPTGHPLMKEIDQILGAMLPVSLAWLESDLAAKRLSGLPNVNPLHVEALQHAESQQRQALERAVERIRGQVHSYLATTASASVDSVNFQDLRETVDELQAAQDAREELRQVLGS